MVKLRKLNQAEKVVYIFKNIFDTFSNSRVLIRLKKWLGPPSMNKRVTKMASLLRSQAARQLRNLSTAATTPRPPAAPPTSATSASDLLSRAAARAQNERPSASARRASLPARTDLLVVALATCVAVTSLRARGGHEQRHEEAACEIARLRKGKERAIEEVENGVRAAVENGPEGLKAWLADMLNGAAETEGREDEGGSGKQGVEEKVNERQFGNGVRPTLV